MCFVYWIYNDTCFDVKLHGYIGISHTPEKRFKTHLRKKRVPADSLLKILFEGLRKECFDIEYKLRPIKGIGWNNAVGGSHGWRIGFNHDEETKRKMQEAWTIHRKERASLKRKEINNKNKGKKRPEHSIAMSGENNPMFGVSRPQYVKDAVSKAHKGKISHNRQELYCIECQKRASVFILKKYHTKCFRRFCDKATYKEKSNSV